MACVAAVSAIAVTVSDASGVYQGTLNIGGDDYPNEEVYILPGVTANTITFVLPNFQFSGVPLGDIVLVNIPMNGSGQLTLNNLPLYIKAINEHAEVSMVNGSQISGTIANVTLSIEAGLPEPIPVVFEGDKVTGRNYFFNNAGFEDNWHTVDKGVEPDYWHSFNSGTGSLISAAKNNVQLTESSDVRSGATGTKSALLKTNVVFGVKANGNLTNGQINAGSMSASDGANNYNFSDPSNTGFNTDFVGQPDSLAFWVKYVPASGSNETVARAHATITTNAYYKDPETGGSYNNVKVAEATIEYGATGNIWKRVGTSFDYSTVGADQAAYILINFTTNRTPGGGNATKNNPDLLYLDDIEIVYNHALETFKMGNNTISFSNGHANTTAEFSDSDYTFTATTNGKAAKSFIGFDEEHNQVLVYVVADSYSQAKAYSVYTLQMAEPVRDTEYAYSATTCANEPYSDELFSNLSEAGSYTTRIPNSKGGDSIITLTLSVLPTYAFPAEATTKMNELYVWREKTYQGLTPGVYTFADSLQTKAGCDSVYTLTLSVQSIGYWFEETMSACVNEEAEWHQKALPTVAEGTYVLYDSLLSMYGQDSVYQLTLRVHPIYLFTEEKYVNEANLEWRGKTIQNLPKREEPYLIYDSLTTQYGCDSIYMLRLHVSDIPITYGSFSAECCEGEFILFDGVEYRESFDGDVRISEKNIYGGDSIVHVTITVFPSYFIEEELTIVVGEEIQWEYYDLSQFPISSVTLKAEYWSDDFCDSTRVLYLTVIPEPISTGVQNANADPRVARKVLYNGKIYIIRKDEHIYDVLGKKIK